MVWGLGAKLAWHEESPLCGGSGGLRKEVNHGDKQG